MRGLRLVAGACGVLVVTGTVSLAVSGQPRSGAQPSIKGVWRNTEETTTGQNARTIKNQPGFLIFTDKYYSFTRVSGDRARPEVPPADKRTDKQLADSALAFVSWAGTYGVTGSEITIQWLVTLDPNLMRPGNSRTFTYKVDGNTLSLTQKSNNNVPIQTPSTFKYARVE